MAYAAVVSVVRLLDQLLHTDRYPVGYPKPQIESLYDKVCSLQSVYDDENDLENQIRDVMYKAQDSIEFFISSQIRSEEIPQNSTSILLQVLEEIIAKLDSFTARAEKIGGSIGERNQDLFSENARPFKSESTKIVGLEKDLELLRGELLKDISQLQVVPITGMGGIGKTTLARSIYNDPHIQSHFSIRSWVTVSQVYRFEDILLNLLISMESKGQKLGEKMRQGSDEQIGVYLYQCLYNNRYLIVMDDIWDTVFWDKVRRYFPDNMNGSRIVLTSRISVVADYAKSSILHHQMRFLDEEDSWILLREKVFGDEPCPPQLENIGRNIAANCRGLPLSITVVSGILSRKIKTEYWESIQEDVFASPCKDQSTIMEILSLSYRYLPGELKGCFLYMAAFPDNTEILVSKLIKLWVAEVFLTPSPHESLEQVAEKRLQSLTRRNLILIHKFSSDGQIKTCGMHSALRDFAMKECQQEKFLHTINRYVREHSEDAESQRRISIHKNILMCTEDVYKCTRSIKLARSLLYAGPDHHHPLPFCPTFDLLRVLDALAVYFIELPNALFELIHLRYLAFTYDEDLPPEISKLRNLLILIVGKHPKIMIRRPLILPMEIWNMPQIRHLLLTESVLPHLSGEQNSVLLEILQSLSNVNAACCTEEVLQNMPNLKKLGIWIEAPGALHFYLNQLQHLEALKFSILKPILEEKIDFLPKFVFPVTLKKLSLSGCGISWEDMTIIGQLPCLRVLKLRELAFQGPEWRPIEGEFNQLKFLLLESLDLEKWDADCLHFPSLESLIIRHCYELEEISSGIGEIPTLQLIELVDCSPPAVMSARKSKEEQESLGNEDLQLRIHSSWE